MLTPIDIQNHSLKTAVRGYSKKETDDFLEEIFNSFEELYRENKGLKDKVASLSEGIQYYKGMESTLQKALVLAEKTSTETQEAAKTKADTLISEAETKSEAMIKEAKAKAEALEKEANAYAEIEKAKAKQELDETRNHVRKLVQSYENYRLQFKKLAESQIEMLESEHYGIFAPELDEMLEDAPNADEAMEATTIADNTNTDAAYEEDEVVCESLEEEKSEESKEEITEPYDENEPVDDDDIEVKDDNEEVVISTVYPENNKEDDDSSTDVEENKETSPFTFIDTE